MNSKKNEMSNANEVISRLREENDKLRGKLSEYEELLEEVVNAPAKQGKVTAIGKKFVRVSINGNDTFLPMLPDLIPSVKVGNDVLLNEKVIIDILPEELREQPEPVEFKAIQWSQIGGMKSQISKIREIVEYPILHSNVYKEYGLTPSKGLLLYGPPGCGKTMIAKAIASTSLASNGRVTENSFVYLKGGEMLSPYVGVAENNIKKIFDTARHRYKKEGLKTCIFIDEAEAILPARGSRRSSDVESTIVPTFLSEMDGFDSEGTFIILATNIASALDPAIIRPGRIDLKVKIDYCTQEDAQEIFNLYLCKTKCADDVNSLSQLASELLFTKSSKISGAIVKNIVDSAIQHSIKEVIKTQKKTGVTLNDIVETINNYAF